MINQLAAVIWTKQLKEVHLHLSAYKQAVGVFKSQSVSPEGFTWQFVQSTNDQMCLPDYDAHQWKDANSDILNIWLSGNIQE